MIAIRPPQPGRLDQIFWDALREGRFLLHRCGICGCHYWPASCCVEHGAGAMNWVETSGRGAVHTYTVFHRAYTPDLADQIPYVLAVVKLDEGPFFHARLNGLGDGQTLHRGFRVRVDWVAPVTNAVPPPFCVDNDS